MNGATINGVKPIVSQTVHTYGTTAGAKEAAPKASEVAGEGASDPGTGKHIAKPAESKPALAGSAEVLTPGSTAEEQKKKLASTMYPSSRGLRQYGA